MKKKHIWLIALCLAIALFIYPFASTGFLYRNAEVLQGRISSLQGASVVLFLDPSFYYKFRIAPSDAALTISTLGLNESSSPDYDLNMMKTHGPWFWNAWWWHPTTGPLWQLFTGNRDGNDFYFLYNHYSRVAYLYIQNT